MAGDKLINVKADTIDDFMDNAHKAMKDNSNIGDTAVKVGRKVSTDPKTGKITKGTLTLTTTITRAHWAGPAKTKPDKANLDAINKAERLNKAHEEAHRASYEKAFKKAKAALEKEMEGKDEDEADEIVDKMLALLKDACEDLHKTGGMITFKDNGKGKITVSEGPAGPGGCD